MFRMAHPRSLSAYSSLLFVIVGLLVSCSSSEPDCNTNVDGTVVCSGYADAYPYDYGYVGSASGYYPYTVAVYDDPAGYDVSYYSTNTGSRLESTEAPVDGGQSDARATDAGAANKSHVPELLDKARKGANAINAGIRTTLDPIKDLTKTIPALSGDTATFGPMDRGPATYRFTLRRLSAPEKRYGWKLEGRPAGSSASFTLVAGGSIRVGDTPRRGRGVLGADYDAQSSVDSSVRAKGKLLLGFADDATSKILHYVLDGYTPDSTKLDPLDARAFAWNRNAANDVRVALRTNLEQTESTALETVAIKLRWRKDAGARADAVATGGDIPQGSLLFVSTCVPASLDRASASTTATVCSAAATACTPGTITCPNGLENPEEPNQDPTADDPPADIPEKPEAPSAVPDGTADVG